MGAIKKYMHNTTIHCVKFLFVNIHIIMIVLSYEIICTKFIMHEFPNMKSLRFMVLLM